MTAPPTTTVTSRGERRRSSGRRRASSVIGAVLLAMAVAACAPTTSGSGDIVSISVTDLPYADVSSVRVTDDIDVTIRVDPAATPALQLRIDDNLTEDFEVKADDAELEIGFRALGQIEPSERPTVIVTVPRLVDLRIDSDVDGDIHVIGVDEASVDVTNDRDEPVTFESSS